MEHRHVGIVSTRSQRHVRREGAVDLQPARPKRFDSRPGDAFIIIAKQAMFSCVRIDAEDTQPGLGHADSDHGFERG
jgi:hypothetical protein